MQMQFPDKFDQFINSYIDQSTADNRGLVTLYDEEWISPCLVEPSTESLSKDSEVLWRPIRQNPSGTLNNIATALEMNIPEELSCLLGRYYSLDLNAKTSRGHLTILQAWNEHDFERLQKNLVAHVLMKRKLKQYDTLFFALTDEEDYVISVVPSSGEVVLEYVGKPPQEVLAPNLSKFIEQLSPIPTFATL